jgi:hypothetical protein
VVVRFLVVGVLLVASCQTSGQAKIVTVSAAGAAVVGGSLEYETRGLDHPPVSLVFGGIVAIASFVSIFMLDDMPRIDEGERWRPDDHRLGSALLAALQRTGGCLGWCPAYSVAVYRDGTVKFHGRAGVKVCGESVGKVSADKVSELERKLLDARVTSMDRSYDHWDVLDASIAYLWFRPAAGRTKGIAHYLGDSSAPAALSRAEAAVDAAANVDQWIGDSRGEYQTCE